MIPLTLRMVAPMNATVNLKFEEKKFQKRLRETVLAASRTSRGAGRALAETRLPGSETARDPVVEASEQLVGARSPGCCS